jgi:F-type H+-transporting ATPase subunit delta
MRNPKVTIRYAKSLLTLSNELNKLEEVYTDMRFLRELCSDSKDFLMLLKSPIIKVDLKLSVLNKILKKNISDLSMSFIELVTKKKRESLLQDIANDFLNLYNVEKNITPVVLTTAVKIDDSLRKEVLSFIKKQGKENIELVEKVDASIVGGAIIKMGDKQLDTSVSSKIKLLKQTFNKNLYIQDY